MKHIIPILVVLLVVSSGFVGVSNTTEEQWADTDTMERDEFLDDLAFYCLDASGSNAKYEYYKDKLFKDFSNEDIEVEEEELTITIESPTNLASVGPMDSPWSMQSHDTHHTGRSPYSTANTTDLEKWRFYTDGWVEDTPVIANDGTIYFGGNYGGLPWYLFAVYPDGIVKWRYETGGLIYESSPAIAEDGTIYVGSWDDYLYAINPNGILKWRFLTHATIASSPAIEDDGTIYFGTMDGELFALNPNGTEKWHYSTGASIISDPAIGNDGTIYVGSQDNYFYAINPNGTLKWRFQTGDWISGNPTIANDGTIYIGSFDDYFYALYHNGTMKWKFNSGVGTSNSASIGDDGTIYVATDHLYARNADGSKKWNFNFGGYCGCKSSPAVSADGTIYVGLHKIVGDGGKIIAVNSDGTKKWEKTIAQFWVYSSPSIAEDGTVYIGSSVDMSCGYLHAFGPVESNSPPETPTISGKINGKAGTEYKYTFVANDPDNNPVSFHIEWDDGIFEETTFYGSGVEITKSHSWTQPDIYTITVRAEDTFGIKSHPTTHDITIIDKLLPKLEIQQIKGGLFKVNTVVKNTGDADANNVTICINLDGGFILFGSKTICFENIPLNEGITVFSDLIVGFGVTTVTVDAITTVGISDTRIQTAFILLCLIRVDAGG